MKNSLVFPEDDKSSDGRQDSAGESLLYSSELDSGMEFSSFDCNSMCISSDAIEMWEGV